MAARTRVVILFGGRSAEHEVSILSARKSRFPIASSLGHQRSASTLFTTTVRDVVPRSASVKPRPRSRRIPIVRK